MVWCPGGMLNDMSAAPTQSVAARAQFGALSRSALRHDARYWRKGWTPPAKRA